MSVELILLSVNINLISFSIFTTDIVGQIFTMLTLTVAAAEAAIGLAIIVIYYRNRGSIRVEDIHEMKGWVNGICSNFFATGRINLKLFWEIPW